MPVVVDLTQGGERDGMLAATTSPNVPGKKVNQSLFIAKVELMYPWSYEEVREGKTYDGCLYKMVVATTSNGKRFIWKDQTKEPPVTENARQYGSAVNPPMHWGQAEWEAMFGKRP